jgi:AAA15 family ATPase/GTPase
MARPNVTFLNVAAQLHHPLIQNVYNWLDKTRLPMITPSQQNLLIWTLEHIEKNVKMKKDLLSFLAHAYFKHINDIVIKENEIPASFLERIPENERAELKTPNGKYTIKEAFITYKYKKEYNLPLQDESRGTQRMLELAGPFLMILKNKMFLCIDEIEMSLHEELLDFLLRTFLKNSSGSQILFTSHNQALMESDMVPVDSKWMVEKGEDGGSTYRCLANQPGIRKAASRVKLYKAGKFGALPNISEYIMADNSE